MDMARVLCFLAFFTWTLALIQVDKESQLFVDTDTQQIRIFHGVNAVYKLPPWHPETDTFDHALSLCEEDARRLASWGFNVVRLGVMWPGVEVARGSYNATYLSIMKDIVDTLGKHGIYSIIDVHQDLISRKFCGEGAPDFYFPTPSVREFPSPLHEPYEVDEHGYPSLKDCFRFAFFKYYFTTDVSSAFQSLYDDMSDDLVNLWIELATTFVSSEYILGYELINEPWPGDIYADPDLLLPGIGDKKHLTPLYKRIHSAIRDVDDKHIIFFEPTVSDIATSGFKEGPGGASFNDRQAYSYHVYCTGKNRTEGDPSSIIECDAMDEYYFVTREADVERIGCGSFVTEFGALDDKPIAVESIHFVTDQVDSTFGSWAWWQYKSFVDITTAEPSSEGFYDKNGNLQKEKVRALSRTYPRRIDGIPKEYSFDPINGSFDLTYTLGMLDSSTEVFFNEEFYYPLGLNFEVKTGNADISLSNGTATIKARGAKIGDEISILFWPK